MPFEVAPAGQSAREVDGDLTTFASSAVDVWASGEGQTEQPGDLVESLTRGVVDRRAERIDTGRHVLDQQQARVPAADQQRHAGLGQRPVLELVDGNVGGEVVDAVQRLVEREGECLRGGDTDEQRAGESRDRT